MHDFQVKKYGIAKNVGFLNIFVKPSINMEGFTILVVWKSNKKIS